MFQIVVFDQCGDMFVQVIGYLFVGYYWNELQFVGMFGQVFVFGEVGDQFVVGQFFVFMYVVDQFDVFEVFLDFEVLQD